jgi:hypothetical protein
LEFEYVVVSKSEEIRTTTLHSYGLQLQGLKGYFIGKAAYLRFSANQPVWVGTKDFQFGVLTYQMVVLAISKYIDVCCASFAKHMPAQLALLLLTTNRFEVPSKSKLLSLLAFMPSEKLEHALRLMALKPDKLGSKGGGRRVAIRSQTQHSVHCQLLQIFDNSLNYTPVAR